MAVEQTELKFKFDKKGYLHVEYKEKEKTDAGDIITSRSPEKHDVVNADEKQREMLVDALVETTKRYLSGDSISYFNE